jgi:hypothetical protein
MPSLAAHISTHELSLSNVLRASESAAEVWNLSHESGRGSHRLEHNHTDVENALGNLSVLQRQQRRVAELLERIAPA